MRRLILIVIIVGLLYWQWDNIASLANKTFDLFGWGFIFLVIAFITLVVVMWRRKVKVTIYHWNQWLGGIVFTLTAWGILAFFELGR